MKIVAKKNAAFPIAAVMLAAAAFLQAAPAAAQTAPPPGANEVYFRGTDHNWFNPANWSSGRVPTLADCVVLDGGDDVIIDLALNSTSVPTARGGDVRIIVAALKAQPGTTMESRDQSVIATTGRAVFEDSGWIGGDLVTERGRPVLGGREGGLWLDPSAVNKGRIVLVDRFRTQIGLGGRTPASVTVDAAGNTVVASGYGHYSTLTAESMTLGGHLWLNLHHDFKPARGDRFQIVSAGRSSGQFTGLPEGALAACTKDGMGLSITYRGGDGNDVELIARDASFRACRAPTVQPLFQIGGRLAIDNPGVALTREHILLARQVGVPAF